MKIWGRANSINVQKVLWAAEECGIAYERTDVGGAFGGNDQKWYLDMNPNGVVPTIDDDGFILWESNASLRYLAEKYGRGTLWPEDRQVRADADRWMDWATTTFWNALRPVFHQLIRTAPENRNMDLVAQGVEGAAQASTILERYLEGRDFVAGSEFTMGDIPIGQAVYRWYAMDIERPDRPNIRAWYERLGERPGYAEYIMIRLE